jgi:hypothetical protein
MQHAVILRPKPDATEEAQANLRRAEIEKVWDLIVSGELRSIHFIPGARRGAFLQLETPDRPGAEAVVRSLPRVEAGVVDVEILALEPFTGLEILFAPRAAR